MGIKKYLEIWVIPHRRGIMGTVIFHLLLAILLLGMGISRMTVHSEMEIVMDVPEPEQIEKQQQEKQRKEEIRQKSSAEEVERMLRSIAVNENMKTQTDRQADNVEQYIDEIVQEARPSITICPCCPQIQIQSSQLIFQHRGLPATMLLP